MRGGTYLVARRIRMLIEVWDRASLSDQEQTIGRHKAQRRAARRPDEHDELDLRARRRRRAVIPADAHVRLAAPSDQRRRGDPAPRLLVHRRLRRRARASSTPGCSSSRFQRDPRAQFVRIQRRLGADDALNEYIKHIGSAIFAFPPGARRGGCVGEGLLARGRPRLPLGRPESSGLRALAVPIRGAQQPPVPAPRSR